MEIETWADCRLVSLKLIIMNKYFTLGHYIKVKRKECKLTQLQLAEMLYIDRSFISKIENDNILPSESLLIEICELLQIDIKKCNDLMSANYLRRNRILKFVLACLLLATLLMVLTLTIPFLKYPDYAFPWQKTHQLVYSSLLVISLKLHKPFPLLTLIILVIYALFLFLLLVNVLILNKKILVITIFSLFVVACFTISVVFSYKDFINEFYYPYF